MVDHLPYSRNCFVCGIDDPNGLGLRFAAANDGVTADFTPAIAHEDVEVVLRDFHPDPTTIPASRCLGDRTS